MSTRLLGLTAVAVGFCSALEASSICATIGDRDGQPLPRTTMRVVSLTDSTMQYSASGNSKGVACVNRMPEGLYAVEASEAGFMNVRYYPVRVTFPHDVALEFRLPFGEISEGLGLVESTVSGTLTQDGRPAEGIKICLFQQEKPTPAACSITNDLGQYALTVAPGKYAVQFYRSGRLIETATLDLTSPGFYRNRLLLGPQPRQ